MISDHLPAVLQSGDNRSSISMERALKQIRDLVESVLDDDDRVNASLDDLDLMIERIKR